jgi:hypothetical protein
VSNDDRCLNCNEVVRVINYALGEQLMHVDPRASFPTERKGTAWHHCRQRVATTTEADATSAAGDEGTS